MSVWVPAEALRRRNDDDGFVQLDEEVRHAASLCTVASSRGVVLAPEELSLLSTVRDVLLESDAVDARVRIRCTVAVTLCSL